MLNEMDEQFELWWDGYQGLPLSPADISVMNFQDAFRAGYEAGQKELVPLYQEEYEDRFGPLGQG